MKKKLKAGHFKVGRRNFLRLTTAGVAGVYFTGCDGDPPMNDAGPGELDAGQAREEVRALVIGSGFGGAISALRLAEAGVPATVLERGRRWDLDDTFDTFTTTQEPDGRAAWMSRTTTLSGPTLPLSGAGRFGAPYTGLLERIPGENLHVVTAAGVGGGSLVYSGMMLQPPRAHFESVFPSALSYDEMDTTWYPRVLEIMRPGRLPDAVLASANYNGARVFIRDAEAAGYDVERIRCAFDFDVLQQEIDGAFPFPQATVGDYLYGLNNGAKHSIDRVGYLQLAEATGMVDVRPLHQVTEIGARPDGGYYAIAELIDEHGRVQSTTRFEADALFLSAGSMGTTKLLLKAKRDGTLPDLNDQVGQNWGNNGQRIFARTGLTESVGPIQGGPACIIINDHDNAEGPIGIEYGPAPLFEDGAIISACQGVPDRLGSLTLDAEGNITTVWDLDNDASAERAAFAVMNRIVETAGGTFDTNYIGTAIPRATYHPLGGATLGTACDMYGRVEGYAHLYVVDGALVPGSTPACNPFWTISAIAERCLDTIVAEDFSA